MSNALSPSELKKLLDSGTDITVLDVRRSDDRADVECPIPGARWKDPERIAEWSKELAPGGRILVYCVHGHQVSKGARDFLREQGLRTHILEGGIEAWQAFSKGS